MGLGARGSVKMPLSLARLQHWEGTGRCGGAEPRGRQEEQGRGSSPCSQVPSPGQGVHQGVVLLLGTLTTGPPVSVDITGWDFPALHSAVMQLRSPSCSPRRARAALELEQVPGQLRGL